MNEICKINVLGTEYTVATDLKKENEVFSTCSGYCDSTIKTLYLLDIADYDKAPDGFVDPEKYQCKVLRHEITHAFFEESGLGNSTVWEREQVVDWFAMQFHKISNEINKAEKALKKSNKLKNGSEL